MEQDAVGLGRQKFFRRKLSISYIHQKAKVHRPVRFQKDVKKKNETSGTVSSSKKYQVAKRLD